MGRSCCETQHLVGRMLDHIVLVTSNLRQDAEWLADRTGISGTYGGHNPVNGTHNMLFPLSAGAYLELLAADEQRPATAERALPFGLDQMTGRSVAAWAARVADFDATVSLARAHGVPLGDLAHMSRRRPDGHELRWRMTYPLDREPERLCPFLIDWGSTEHPTAGLDRTRFLAVTEFTTLSPVPYEVERWLAVLGLRGDLAVAGSDLCGFNLTVRGPDGIVALRGDNGRPEGLVGDRSGSQPTAKAGEETEGEDE